MISTAGKGYTHLLTKRPFMENISKGSRQGLFVPIAEKTLIDAFAKRTKGLIEFKDVADMVRHPSRYDTALIFLLDRFFSSSAFVFALCAVFGTDAVQIYHMRNYIRFKLTKQEKNLLKKWQEQS